MAGAITAATGAVGTSNYTHVGIAVVGDHTGQRENAAGYKADSVIEATDGGVRIVALADFLADAGKIDGHPAVTVLRLRDTTGVAAAVRRARSFLGLPYDYSFRPDNGKLYCSELVWECYRAADGSRLFSARPMNFRAADGTIPPFWRELFARLGESIPEGIPGTNPNDMARDTLLVEIGRWY